MKAVDAVVFSAGGMFGAWQVGAWQGLEGVCCPAAVIGASIGALNGWMVAGGCPASEMAALWLEAGEFARLRWRRPATAAGGLLDATALEEVARRLHAGFRPSRRIGVVCTEVRGLRQRLFRDGEITWRHLAASCAVPLLLPAYELPDGQRYWDGGFLSPAPLWAAAEMGARRVLVIQVLPPAPWQLRLGAGILKKLTPRPPRTRRELEVVRIAPPRGLGSLGDAIRWRRDNIQRWLEEGREAALAAAGRLA